MGAPGCRASAPLPSRNVIAGVLRAGREPCGRTAGERAEGGGPWGEGSVWESRRGQDSGQVGEDVKPAGSPDSLEGATS